MNHKTVGAAVALAVILALAGCKQASGDAAGTSAAAAPASGASGAGGPAVSVTAVRADKRDYEVQLEATGTVTALNSVDVKPQVSSVINQVHIREGQFVKAGELLFTLDARTDEANLAKAQAQLQKDLASLADAQRQLTRSRELFAQNFISQGAVDTNQALVDAQKAGVAADRAAIDAAKVALSFARIVAPGAGRAGAINVFPGSYVQPSSPPLVTITQLDPIAIAFSLPQRNLPEALQTLRDGGGKVTAVLPEGRGSLGGKLNFVDNAVDPNSGAVKVKAVFDNKNQSLWPGAFVPVKLSVQTLKDVTVVPQAAIVQGARGKVVFVIEPDNRAGMRQVEIVTAGGTDAVVTGVRPGERVVVDGRQNLRPGMSVVERPGGGASDAASGGRGRRSAASDASRGASGGANGGAGAMGAASAGMP
jgi:RND family efflux transporter MFP subunit